MAEEELQALADIRRELHAVRLQQQSVPARVWDGLMKAAVAGVLALFSWQWTQEGRISNNEAELRVVESNRFTAADGADMERRLKTELPPAWLLAIVNDLKAQNADILQRLSRMEARLGLLEESE